MNKNTQEYKSNFEKSADFEDEENPEQQEKLKRGIKLAIIGPPNSGKSVFENSLRTYYDTSDCYVFRASPDGEGQWFHKNYNQPQAMEYRKKGEYSEDYVEDVSEAIESWDGGKLLIIDTGGKMTDELAAILKNATHSIILTNDIRGASEWQDFSDKCNVENIAVINSKRNSESEDDQDLELVKNDIQSHANKNVGSFVLGQICGINRGCPVEENETLKRVVDLIDDLIEKNTAYTAEKNKHKKDANELDVVDFMSKFPHDNTIRYTKDGEPRVNVIYKPESLPQIYEAINSMEKNGDSIKLNGPLNSWGAIALGIGFQEKGYSIVKFYSPFFGYVEQRSLPQGFSKHSSIIWDVNKSGRFNDQDVYIVHNDVNAQSNKIDPKDLTSTIIPELPEESVVIISTAGPNWFKSSIALGYKETCSAIAVIEPGGKTIVAWSKDKDVIGNEVI